jgi:hypothetical protein
MTAGIWCSAAGVVERPVEPSELGDRSRDEGFDVAPDHPGDHDKPGVEPYCSRVDFPESPFEPARFPEAARTYRPLLDPDEHPEMAEQLLPAARRRGGRGRR